MNKNPISLENTSISPIQLLIYLATLSLSLSLVPSRVCMPIFRNRIDWNRAPIHLDDHPSVRGDRKKTKSRKVRTFSQLETSDNSGESGTSGTVSWINFRKGGEGENFIARFLARILNRNSRQVLELSWPEHLRNFVQISWFSPSWNLSENVFSPTHYESRSHLWWRLKFRAREGKSLRQVVSNSSFSSSK